MISIKTPEEIEIMTEGGKILAGIMEKLEKEAKPGITTEYLDRVAETLILNSGAKPSFKGYRGFPASLCTSLNEEIVHAIPSKIVLEEGDIISLDLGIYFKGFHTDMAITLPVGKIKPEAEKLIKITKKALEIGINQVKLGNHFGDISRAIQKYVESSGFNVVRELCGHGIGKNIHEDPEILNAVSFDKETVDKVEFQDDARIKIKEGMTFCLEPMVTVGEWRIKKSKDGYGWKTKDGSLSAHFEHTVAVVENEVKILTELE